MAYFAALLILRVRAAITQRKLQAILITQGARGQ
jgi:hypothetical protein